MEELGFLRASTVLEFNAGMLGTRGVAAHTMARRIDYRYPLDLPEQFLAWLDHDRGAS